MQIDNSKNVCKKFLKLKAIIMNMKRVSCSFKLQSDFFGQLFFYILPILQSPEIFVAVAINLFVF